MTESINHFLNIIPTPKKCRYTAGKELLVHNVCCIGTVTNKLNNALTLLQKDCSVTFSDKEKADLIVVCGEDELLSSETGICKNELGLFEEKFAAEQGYILKKQDNGPVIIVSREEMGCVYGLMTLMQILGKKISSIDICDWPDFQHRGIKWLLWAECGIWSYDFGDGAEALKERLARKLDLMLKYKLNLVVADGFGFDADRFPEYADIMRSLCDNARVRGIHVAAGGYSSGYGMAGHLNAYQGKAFLNRTSYPDGEIYECIGTYEAYPMPTDTTVDRSIRLTEVRARTHGTCLSNEALLDQKLEELSDYVRKTHIGELYLHNMDAHEIHPELWKARCEHCRRKWPNDDLFARDGAAGAFAYYCDSIIKRLKTIKDGDYDAARDLVIKMVSPGYCYSGVTSDEDYDTGVKFWASVCEYMTESDNFTVGFREQYFYQDKNVRRAETVEKLVKKARSSTIVFGCGDGFYDDKLFTPFLSLAYIMKGFDRMTMYNGNAFQEPLQVFNAEYLWNCENSGFYNYSPRPETYEEYVNALQDLLQARIVPEEVYGEGGFLDIICEKLYGSKIGEKMSEIYKLSGKNGEPPIGLACNVDIYTNYQKAVYPMRWDNEDITKDNIDEMTERFYQCSLVTNKADTIMQSVLEMMQEDIYPEGMKSDLTWFAECFCMGDQLCNLLYKYMCIYRKLHDGFEVNTLSERSDMDWAVPLEDEIIRLRTEIQKFREYLENSNAKPVDKLGGSMVRREEMGEFLDYNTALMLSSIKTAKRIPDDRKPLRTRSWW